MEDMARSRITQRVVLACGLLVGLPVVMALPAYGQAVTQFSYDAGDHVVKVTDPRGLVTSSTYDGLGQKWQQVSPDTGTTTYSYDAYGRLATMTRAGGNQVGYGYDGIGRRTSVNSAGIWQTFTYDNCTNGVGRLCSVVDFTSTISYVYSPEGWVTGRSLSVGGTGYWLGYSYDALGHTTVVVYPDGNEAHYLYTHGVISAVQMKIGGVLSNVATNIFYQPGDAAMAQWTSSNGLTNSLSYDTDGRLTGISVPGVQSLGVSYDTANRVVGIANGVDNQMSQSFGYDAMSRLTSAYSAGADNESFSYDANGNRQSQMLNGAWTTVTANGSNNQVTQLSGASNVGYGYDARGNLTTVAGVSTFTYDVFNRLASAGSATYYVSPEGQRLRKSVNGVSTFFAPDASGPLLAENSGSGWNDYVWLNGRLIGRTVGGQLQAIHDDQVGRPEAVTDASRTVVWRARNYAFDRTVVQDNVVPLNLGYPGQYYDAESELWNNGFRDYSPSLGRYIESDPIGLSGGINTYAYVGGNPLSHVDPYGLEEETEEGRFDEMEVLFPRIGFNLVRAPLESEVDRESRWESCPRTNSLPSNAGQRQHIFRSASGHLAEDTPANQELLESTANNLDYLRGTDAYGNSIYTQSQTDGSQVWVTTRGGVIQNGGVNAHPWTFVPGVGLRPGR
ncbi:RHS repeat-associated core domain-containing protein [Dyella silvae]|uniref:RHS repeat-associated core domain-containing protein n=1 Tax=Dyella silvae TaxID=2994424 RepID=UPI002263E2BB|nr:RHS repeat-associated core domain-containing protein [Dyella silvae]